MLHIYVRHVFFVNIILYIYVYCGKLFARRSILVSAADSEEGPKNPLKGISMKSLVLAFYAQFRVGAGG